MWRKEDEKPQSSAGSHTTSHPAAPQSTAYSGASPSNVGTPAAASHKSSAACVSQGIRIKGEITGSEDLFIDGTIDGKVTVANAVVTVGPNAVVKAEITGREVVVRGRVEGKLTGSDRIQIWSTARVTGDVKAEKISIEEGAELHGKMEAGKQPGSSGDAFKKTESNKVKDGAAVAGAN